MGLYGCITVTVGCIRIRCTGVDLCIFINQVRDYVHVDLKYEYNGGEFR